MVFVFFKKITGKNSDNRKKMKTNKKNNNKFNSDITSDDDIVTSSGNSWTSKLLNKIGLSKTEKYDYDDEDLKPIVEVDYNNLKSKNSWFRRVFRLGVDPKAPSIFSDEIPIANIPDEIKDKSMRNKLENNVNSIYELYSKDILPWPQMLDTRLYIIGLMHESIQWALRSKEEKTKYRKSKDLWMFLHWHFPIVFMWFFYNILGTYKLGALHEQGVTDNDYIRTEMFWVIFFSAALAWLLDFVWEPIESTIYDVVIYYMPYSSFSRGFGRETRTNSVTIDPVVSGLFGILFMITTIMLMGQAPVFGITDWICWVQFIILWWLPKDAGKSIFHLICWTIIECVAIFCLQYIWIEAELWFVLTWIIGACTMSTIIGLGGLSYYMKVPTLISEPLYTAVLIGIPCHIIYSIIVTYISLYQ
jgi:hypothetical protein